jgi:hypothetical protein
MINLHSENWGVISIKHKITLSFWLALSLFILGVGNAGKLFFLPAKYITGLGMAVFFLMLAALVLEITRKSHELIILKIGRIAVWILTGSAFSSFIIFPLLANRSGLKLFDDSIMAINLGLVLFLFFMKEVVRNWKVRSYKPVKQRPDKVAATFFEGLPRITRHKKISRLL